MKTKNTMGVIAFIAATAVLLSGCGGTSGNTGSGGSGASEAVEEEVESKEEAKEANVEEETESEEIGADQVEVLNEQGVSIGVGSSSIEGGKIGFTLYFTNTGTEKRMISGNSLYVNGETADNPSIETHTENSYQTSDSIFAYLDGGEMVWLIFDIPKDEIQAGDAVQIDCELEAMDDDHNTLETKMLEFGINAEGEVLLGDDLKALGLAPTMIIETETFPETVFYDENDIKITAQGFTLNEENARAMNVTVTNNTSSEIRVNGNTALVDGYEIKLWGDELNVAAGETASGEFVLNKQDMERSGITSIHEIATNWDVRGDEVENSRFAPLIYAETDMESGIKERDISQLSELYNSDGIAVYAELTAHKDQFDSTGIYLFYENDTDDVLKLEPIILHSDGGSTSGYGFLYPHSKLWEESIVYEGDTLFVRVSKVISEHESEKIVETDEVAITMP